MSATTCLVLRLAAPLQSWGGQTEFNRRETASEPSYSGILGLLAAAQGRRREDPIVDLLQLRLGVRVDRPGSLLRDYHTVSELDGRPLRSAQVSRSGVQKRTSPAKYTAVTHRFYLQDAAFVAVVQGPDDLLVALADALLNPTFPLALGRRACPPTHPLLLRPAGGETSLWTGDLRAVISRVPWQVSRRARQAHGNDTVFLPAIIHDDEQGRELRADVPVTFDQKERAFTTRRVSREYVEAPSGRPASGPQPAGAPASRPRHDPFALLGW